MRINRLEIEGFQHFASRSFELAPITLFAGPNGCGKSTIRDAIRFVLAGEPGRVKVRGNGALLLHTGARKGTLRVIGDHEIFERDVESGKLHSQQKLNQRLLGCVIDGQSFAEMPQAARREFLLTLKDEAVDSGGIMAELEKVGIKPEHLQRVGPLLRAGFDSAIAESKILGLDAKRQWESVTGEKYGSKKAKTWSARPVAHLAETFPCPHCQTPLARSASQGIVVAAEVSDEADPPADTEAGKRTTDALACHDEVQAWADTVHALEATARSWLSDVRERLNTRMAAATDGLWRTITLDDDLAVRVDGLPFEMLSESEQWRVNAHMADAIAQAAGLGLLVVDRLDLLDLPSRGKYLSWLMGMAGAYDTVICMATLKAPPTIEGVKVIWLGS